MKNAVRLLLAFLLGAALVVIFLRTTEVRPHPAAPKPAAPAPAPDSPPSAAPLAPTAAATDPDPRETAGPLPTPRPETTALLAGQPALEAISDLSASYDAASVPALARYLGHSDPEIRAAARDGLVNLGERAAIPLLEAAATKAPADEAKELRDAAEFLALPTWTERRAAERRAKAEAPAAPR